MGWRAGDSNEQCLNVYVKSLVFILVLFKLLVFFEKTLFNRKTVFILNVNQLYLLTLLPRGSRCPAYPFSGLSWLLRAKSSAAAAIRWRLEGADLWCPRCKNSGIPPDAGSLLRLTSGLDGPTTRDRACRPAKERRQSEQRPGVGRDTQCFAP